MKNNTELIIYNQTIKFVCVCVRTAIVGWVTRRTEQYELLKEHIALVYGSHCSTKVAFNGILTAGLIFVAMKICLIYCTVPSTE